MASTRKERQSNRSLFNQLNDFDQDIFIGSAVSERQGNIVVKEGTNDRYFTVGTSSNISVVDGNAMDVKTWKGVLMKGLTEKRAILLIQSKIGYKMQF